MRSQVDPAAAAATASIVIRRRRQALWGGALLLGGFLLAIAAVWTAVPLRGLLLEVAAAVPDLGLPGRAPGRPLVPGESAGSEQRAQQEPATLLEPFDQVLKDTRTRLEGLTEAAATIAADAKLIDQVLARQIRRNQQLDESLARADAARKAAVAEAEKTQAEMARRLAAAANAAAQWRADLAGFYKELEANDRAIATAKSAREAADRARQAMSHEAASLRSEAARARDELSAARAEIARLRTANAGLEKEIASWRTAALATTPEDERFAATRALPIVQPRASKLAGEANGVQPADRFIERPVTGFFMMGPTAAPPQTGSRLAGLRADIQPLTDLELSTEGADSFSGSASGRTVPVGATAASGTLPVAAKESYLDWLLVYWMAAQRGRGPAVGQVSPSGRVLVERSEP